MPKLKITKTEEIILTEKVRQAYQANFGSEVNYRLGVDFDLKIGQLVELTGLVRDLYFKKVDVLNVDAEILKRFKLEPEKAKEMAKELCGMRLLVVDNEWFEGKVAKKIGELGGNVDDYAEFINEYLADIEKEELTRQSEGAEGHGGNEGDIGEAIKEKINEEPLVVRDPAQERSNAKIVFSSMLKNILGLRDVSLKIELNVRLITLLMNDEEERTFQRELLDLMHENKELITANHIIVGNENVEPSICNWIKDYIGYAGSTEALSSIKKAQYFTVSPNLKKTNADERKIVDNVLKLYFAIKNFYFNLSKYDLSDIYIFPFSEEEQTDYVNQLKEQVAASDYAEASSDKQGDTPRDDTTAALLNIEALFKDKPEDRLKINQEKQRIIEATRKEYDKVADEFELALLNRKRHIIIACLEILAEVGALDNLLVEDSRFQNLLLGYFKRNNLQGEQADFKASPYQGKYVQAFVKFVFLERLGFSESEGARLAANLSNIFRSHGAKEYGQLSYLDLSDNKFKWTEL
jgi:hypothetical protein